MDKKMPTTNKIKQMKNICLILLLLFFYTLTSYGQQPRYSRVILHAGKGQLKAIAALGLPMEGYFAGDGYVCELSADELLKLRNNGIQYTVVIDDVSAFYVNQNDKFKGHPELLKAKSSTCNVTKYNTPAGFSLGSMGGFYTYNEMLANLDSMYLHYPLLITQRHVIDTINTIEGHPMYWVRISNNPIVEQNKPRVLYTGLIHAREPASMQQLIYYMYYLLENYNVNPDITNIINHFELYFIPCLNPDGYLYNESTNPLGGGMWRKNRRDDGGGHFGIDLNRNFGYKWGIDNQGSSNDPSLDTYRGTCSFSEPESRLVASFCHNHTCDIALNYHTYSNFLLYPFGYQENLLTPDSMTYKKMAQILTTENKYAYGDSYQLLDYVSNGDSNDWMYGDDVSKPRIFSLTPEVGSPAFGFWPAMNQIEMICKDNIYQNMYAAFLTGKFARLTDESHKIIFTHHGFFKYNIQNVGLDSAANFTVSIVPLSANIQMVGNPKSYNQLTHLQSLNDSIAFTLDIATQHADTVKYLLVMDNGAFTKSDTIIKIFGNEVTLFSDNCCNTFNWSTTGWGTTTSDFTSAPSSITDSPIGGYQTSAISDITLMPYVNLSGALYAELSFQTKFDVASGYDFVQILISTNFGNTWTPLCGKYTINSGITSILGQPSYEGLQKSWLLEQINLNDYIGNDYVKFKFSLVSDWMPYPKPDGFYFDDFTVKIIDSTLTSSVKDISPSQFDVEVYPNPNNNFLNITCRSNPDNKVQIRIYNATGQLVFSKENASATEKTDVSQWPEGIYMIAVDLNDDHCFYKKFIKF